MRRDRSGVLPFKNAKERTETEQRLEDNRASLDAFRKSLKETRGRLIDQKTTLTREINDLRKKDAKKEQDQIEKTRRDLEKASNERLLDLAKRSKNLEQILALTRAIGEAQIIADTESFVKQEDADKSPELAQARKEFCLLYTSPSPRDRG